jgi:hypothetical protein
MRLKDAAAFALLAAAATPAIAKPPAGAGDADRNLYRLQAVGACVAAHPPGRTYDPQDSRIVADCECAVDRFIAGRDVADLPPLLPGQDKGLLDEPFAQCRAERTGTGPAPAAAAGSPDNAAARDGAGPGPADEDKSPGFDPLAWFSGIGLPRWAWAAIPAFAAALLLFVLLRRRRRSDDLLGPPRSMRPNARPGPRSTWPIDDR